MANFDQQTLEYFTRLCRIRYTEKEQKNLLDDLRKILDYVEQLQEIDTEAVAPLHHVRTEDGNVMRPDEIGETLERDLFLSNAPDQIGGLIRVPPIIKKKG